jgi:hypothetical protein
LRRSVENNDVIVVRGRQLLLVAGQVLKKLLLFAHLRGSNSNVRLVTRNTIISQKNSPSDEN